MSRKAWEGRRPCLPVEDGGGRRTGKPGRAAGEAAAPVSHPPAPSAPAPRRLQGSGGRGRRGCAGSPRAALAHGPLRNRQRRGFPRGGSAAATITQPGRAAPLPPPPHKMAAPMEPAAAAPRAPFCGEASDLSTWTTSAAAAAAARGGKWGKCNLTGEAGVGERSLRGGDHVTRGRRRRRRRSLPPPPPAPPSPPPTPPPSRPGARSLFVFSECQPPRTDGRTGGCSGGLAAG